MVPQQLTNPSTTTQKVINNKPSEIILREQIKISELNIEDLVKLRQAKYCQINDCKFDLIRIQQTIEHSLEQIDFTGAYSMKSSKNPADIMKLTLDAIAIYFSLQLRPIQINPHLRVTKQISVPFWSDSYEESGKYIMGPNFDFKRNLTRFNKDSLNDQTMELLEPLIGPEGQSWFHQKNVQKSSKAMMYLNRWIYAVRDYYQKIKETKQLMNKYDQMQKEIQLRKQN